MFHGYDFDSTRLRIGGMNMLLHGVESPGPGGPSSCGWIYSELANSGENGWHCISLVGRLGRRDPFAPCAQYVLDTLAYLASSRFPVDARHQQLVIVGVGVPDRRRNREMNGVGVEGPPGRASSDPATAGRCRVTRHRVGPAGRTALGSSSSASSLLPVQRGLGLGEILRTDTATAVGPTVIVAGGEGRRQPGDSMKCRCDAGH